MQLSLLIVVALSTIVTAQYTEEDDVLVLTGDTFAKATAEFKYLLVEFYAPWCGHCKALTPEYAKAAKQLKEEGSEARLAKVDATTEDELAGKYNVQGYPTIKLFRPNKEPIEYQAGRLATDILKWLNKKTGPPAEVVKTVEDAKALIAANEILVFGFFKEDTSDDAAESVFNDVADEVDAIEFAKTTATELLNEFDVTKSTVVIFKKFDEGRAEMPAADVEKESLKHFVSKHRLPMVVEFTQEAAENYFSGDRVHHLLLFINKTTSEFEPLLAKFKEAAPAFQGEVLFMYLDISDDDNLRVLEYFGLKASDCPTLRFITLEDDLIKYRPEPLDMSVAGMKQFTQSVLDGKLKPHFMSDPIPADWNSKPVKVLVGDNFESVALDKTKDVIVKFYAPWCGHCKKLTPIWDELGEKFKDRSDLVVAKMDSSSNEHEKVKIASFPTIKYFPKDDGEPIDYEGNRTLEALVKFVESGGKESGKPEEEESKSKEARTEL